MVKIAVVCPLGYLDRHGYQNVYRACIASMAAFADELYLVQSVNDRTGIDELIMQYDNITLISGLNTYFEVENGKPLFDLLRIRDNVNIGIDAAADDDYDVALCVEVNQYVPVHVRDPLGLECAEVRDHDQPYGWLYRRDQLADKTFIPNLRRPWIFNLNFGARLEIPDGASFDGKMIHHIRHAWPEYNNISIVDCALEMTAKDLQDKLEFFRFYHEFCSKRPTSFDLEYWRQYSIAKFHQKQLDGEPLDVYGRAIAGVAALHPDFMSHDVLGAL